MPGFIARLRIQAASIRGRATAVAVALVGATLLIGAVALVTVMRITLTESVRADVQLRAADVVAELEAGIAPSQLQLPTTDDLLIQVLDGNGAVLAAGAKAPSAPMAAGLDAGKVATVHLGKDDDAFLILAARVNGPGEARTVLVARVLDLVRESIAIVTLLLTIGLPIVLLLVAAVAWRLVGGSLAMVEALRAQVDEISGAELHRRVSVPRDRNELARLATTMNAMLERLEQSHARQRQLVADTSHELRSPIATLRQHAEVALGHPEGTTTSELADTVLNESLRLARMVDDLLLLARADERSLDLAHRAVDLDDLVFDAAKAMRRSGTLVVDTSAVSAGRVQGDPVALGRVIANLVENAARHAGRRVALSVAETGAEVVLHVDDDGPGVDVADRARVFGRFVRLDEARARDSGGSGLGLAIVAELVAAHGGTVSIGDSPLGGARVEVRFPQAEV